MNCAFARLRVRSAVIVSRETCRLSSSARLQLLLHPIIRPPNQNGLYLPRKGRGKLNCTFASAGFDQDASVGNSGGRAYPSSKLLEPRHLHGAF